MSLKYLKIIVFLIYPEELPRWPTNVGPTLNNGCPFRWPNVDIQRWPKSAPWLRFYSPVNPLGSCRAWSVCLTILFLGQASSSKQLTKYLSLKYLKIIVFLIYPEELPRWPANVGPTLNNGCPFRWPNVDIQRWPKSAPWAIVGSTCIYI